MSLIDLRTPHERQTDERFQKVYEAGRETAVTIAVVQKVLIESGLVTQKQWDLIRARMSAVMDQHLQQLQQPQPPQKGA